MKHLIFIFLLNCLLNTCFGINYNYYYRNELSGYYEIKNLENLPADYCFVYSIQENQIIGYYYDSEIVKFIDETDGGRVTKSTYFAKETGKVIFEKEFFYGDNSKIKSFFYKQMNDKGEVVYETKGFYLNKDDRIIYNSTGFMKKGNIEHRLIGEGSLLEDYKPIEYKTSGILIDVKNKNSQIFNTEEVFSYNGYNVSSKFFQNGNLYKTKRKFLDDKISKYEEIIFSADGKQKCSKQCSLNDSSFTQIMKTDSETVNKYNYLKIDDNYYQLKYIDWDNSPVTKIEIQDETVYIKNKVVENLKYPINLFDFSMF